MASFKLLAGAVAFLLCLFAPVRAQGDDEPRGVAQAETSGEYGKTTGVLGPVVVGPKLTLIGLPVPFRVGLEAKWQNMFGLGFDYGFVPSVTVSNVSVKLNGWNAAAKWYPWKQAFYIGLALGGQKFTGSMTDTSISDTVTVDFTTTYVAPEIGWRWTWDSGLFFGMELGVQIPISKSSTVAHSNAAVAATAAALAIQNDVNDKANTVGSNPFPHFGLVQVGYFF